MGGASLGQRRKVGEEQAGWTLVELLVVMVVLLTVGGVVVTGIVSGMSATRKGQARVEALTDLETAAQRVTREVRAARALETIEPETLQVLVFRDGGRARHRYSFDDGALTAAREVYEDEVSTTPESSVSSALLDDLSAAAVSTFTYFDGRDEQLDPAVEPASAVERVAVTFRRELPEQDPIEVQTSVFVRNSRAQP